VNFHEVKVNEDRGLKVTNGGTSARKLLTEAPALKSANTRVASLLREGGGSGHGLLLISISRSGLCSAPWFEVAVYATTSNSSSSRRRVRDTAADTAVVNNNDGFPYMYAVPVA
jgi:hypothetical protein